MNLIHNAIKFTPEGGSITLKAENAAEKVQFSIQDTGIGITAEDLLESLKNSSNLTVHDPEGALVWVWLSRNIWLKPMVEKYGLRAKRMWVVLSFSQFQLGCNYLLTSVRDKGLHLR